MNRATFARADLGLVVSGLLDIVFAFSLSLERKGLMPRSELVEALQFVKEQAAAQEGGPTKRTMIAELMLAAFDMPVAGDQVRERWRVIDGGARSPPSK